MALKSEKLKLPSRKNVSSKETVKNREKRVQEMLAALPVMSHKEVRRHRVEYHKALCCELEEEGYYSASKLIYDLIKIDEARRERAGPNSIILLKPKLKNQNDMLDCLKVGLKQAEKEERKGQFGIACTIYLNLALYFQERGENWFWVANTLFFGSYKRGAKYLTDGKRKETISRYAYGKFLLENMKKPKRALAMLESGRSISMGKLWKLPILKAINPKVDLPKFLEDNNTEEMKEENAGKLWERELDDPSGIVGTIYQEMCILLEKALLAMAEEVKAEGPPGDLEVRLCMRALRRAKESGSIKVQIEALKALGLCFMERNDLQRAINYFDNLLRLSSHHVLWEGICDGHQNLGNVYDRMNEIEQAIHHLNEFCKAAKSSGSNSLLGKAFRCLGEFYLLHDDPSQAAKILSASFNEYYLQKETELKAIKPISEKIVRIRSTIPKLKSLDSMGSKNSLFCEYQRLKAMEKNVASADIEQSLNQTRILAAVAKGLRNLPLYADIILQSETHRDAMLALMEWRGNGIPFWKSSMSQPQELLPQEEYSITSPRESESSTTLSDISSEEEMKVYQKSFDNSTDIFHFPSVDENMRRQSQNPTSPKKLLEQRNNS